MAGGGKSPPDPIAEHPMTTTSYSIEPQTPADEPAIEALLDLAFGLSRRTKTSYRFREEKRPFPVSLSSRATMPCPLPARSASGG